MVRCKGTRRTLSKKEYHLDVRNDDGVRTASEAEAMRKPSHTEEACWLVAVAAHPLFCRLSLLNIETPECHLDARNYKCVMIVENFSSHRCWCEIPALLFVPLFNRLFTPLCFLSISDDFTVVHRTDAFANSNSVLIGNFNVQPLKVPQAPITYLIFRFACSIRGWRIKLYRMIFMYTRAHLHGF